MLSEEACFAPRHTTASANARTKTGTDWKVVTVSGWSALLASKPSSPQIGLTNVDQFPARWRAV